MSTLAESQVVTPSHTFMDNKPPLLPRQSTNDVLSFTQIITDRLAPGQNVWDYFSPAPPAPPAPAPVTQPAVVNSPTTTSGPASPALPLSPTSPTTSSFGFFGNKRSSVIIDTSKRPPLPPSPPQCASPTSASFPDPNAAAVVDALCSTGVTPTPKAQKRKSFAQSLRNMLSLSQLLSSKTANQVQTQQPTGPPHYNILVLGSDSAPLASTLYKMSSLLPSTNKISHYQEISGFFVAYFRSNGSFTCSPKSSTELSDRERRRRSGMSFRAEGTDGEVKRRSVIVGLEEIDTEDRFTPGMTASGGVQRSSEESQATLLNARLRHSKDRSNSSTSSSSSASSVETYDNNEDDSTLFQEPLEDEQTTAASAKASANASLSVHAFSLDTTWPVPRILAQTFWFPHAHGIIYIVDATRKNDPRGMDHLLNARQFLSSLIADPHFKRRDIPVVVFANKAGLDDETCFRVDEIADILGCEEWDDEGRVSIESLGNGVMPPQAPAGSAAARPWCVKSTRSDGEGEGLRESVEWLKSRMGEIWKA
ncbi:hypothetical protein BGZ97_013240 [Linnemannia gamsii]|uniref:P-loop containing nucleoside triphosphate hydrolase protein n=1 Tax=Linnemannia gamsii TaxID=64522 RepID=A0A9P6RM41_9FUNG|nr:hypothetical protein BGZ97_013240 [Linnemannia gamsii]